MCVLIVDDAPEGRSALKRLLEDRGHAEVLTAASAEEAFAILGVSEPASAAKEPRIEVVILDVQMPGTDGIEACRRIKAAPHLKHVPVLMLTGCTDEQTLQRAFDAGACDFIAKPFGPADLLARLRSALNLKREIDRCREHERELLEVTAELRRLNEELQRLAVLDELTGVANRRFFNMMLEQEWGRAVRSVLPLSLVLIDIDHFKNYNDHYGHQKGDECLRRVCDRIKAMMKRPGDHLARYGGEELVLVLSHTGALGALAVAERVRAAVEEMALEHACSPVHRVVTVSLGVATAIPERGTRPELLLEAADQALYEAKRQGRNRARLHGGLHGHPLLVQGPHARLGAAEDSRGTCLPTNKEQPQ